MSSDHIKILQEKLVGKTISAIENPANYSECICRFILTDGSSFRLHATDLGCWIQDDISSDNLYPTIDSFIQAIYNNISYDFSKIKSTTLDKNVIVLKTSDGVSFKIKQQVIDPRESQILSHNQVLIFLPKIIKSGVIWSYFFDSIQKNQTFIKKAKIKIPKDLIK